MNKNLKGLLVALVAVGSAHATGTNNKTAFNARLLRSNVPAYTTFHTLTSLKQEKRFGGNVEITGFAGRSVNGSHIAKNFGANGTDSVIVGGSPITYTDSPKVFNTLLIHNYNNDGKGGYTSILAGTLKFDPTQTVYGLRLDYVQKFGKWLKGLYAAANIPFVQYENDIHATVKDAVDQTDAKGNIQLLGLLKGSEFARTYAESVQKELKNGKLSENTKTGFGDLDVIVGWNFVENHKSTVGINGTVVFPTAEKAKTEFLWAARTGECKWGLGAGAHASTTLWEDADQNLKLGACVQYKYLFEGDEHRVVGLNKYKYSASGTIIDPIFSQYYLVGTNGSKGLQPLANVSALNLEIEARSQIEGTAGFAYNNGGFTLDLGGSLLWKEAEGVSLEECWNNTKYGIANPTYDVTANFAAANTLAGDASGFITKSDLNLHGAATPALLVVKVFTGAGYTAKTWEYPVTVGLGVGYEFPTTNRNGLEGYSAWVKGGFAF